MNQKMQLIKEIFVWVVATAMCGSMVTCILVKHKQECDFAVNKMKLEIENKKVDNQNLKTIVKEAIKNSPTRHNVVVHLNPDDFAQYQKRQQENPDKAVSGIEFVADPNIGAAECLLETPKGIIESLINEHLEQISNALTKAE